MRFQRVSLIQSIFNTNPIFIKRYFSLQAMAAKLEQAYQPHIPLEERYCLEELKKEWMVQKPLKDKEILINPHITLATLPMIALLLRTEAHVTVMASPLLTQHQDIRRILTQTGIPVLDAIPALPEKKPDFIYDCGARMLHKLKPTIGMVELTQTDPNLYKNVSVPVITVDQSFTKQLESIGTGESLIRVLNHLIHEDLAQKNVGSKIIPYLFQDNNAAHFYARQHWLIFGYGKVSQGLINALSSINTPSRYITVVETSLIAYLQALRNGYQAVFLDKTDQKSIQQIKNLLPQYFAVITATGVPGFMSELFSQADFPSQRLINYGTFDEYGEKFSPSSVLNQKKPANFMLTFPTCVRYLDAIFVLFLKAGVELLKRPLTKGLHPVSSELDTQVLTQWFKHYGDQLWRFPQKQVGVADSSDSLNRITLTL